MSLREVYRRRLFDDATTDARRGLFYVRPGELGIEPRADTELMGALKDEPAPQRIQVVGPSGAGKTSLIFRVLADLARLDVSPAHEILTLKVGDSPESFMDGTSVKKLVLDTIEAERYRFSNVDPEALREASADHVTETPARLSHTVGLDTHLVTYSADIEAAYKTAQFGQNPARLDHDLSDVLARVAAAGHRPVLVIDDTEKFIGPGSGGALDGEGVSNLYHHGIRALGAFEVDLVIAMHPRFEEVPHVAEVSERFAIRRTRVPELRPGPEPVLLGRILERRLERGEVEVELGAVIDPEAVADLQLLYHERASDLRSVLKVAHAAAELALGEEGERIEPRHVRAAVVG
jgi:hypothetical protein